LSHDRSKIIKKTKGEKIVMNIIGKILAVLVVLVMVGCASGGGSSSGGSSASSSSSSSSGGLSDEDLKRMGISETSNNR